MLARTPLKSKSDALADRHYRHLEFVEVARDPHDCLLTDRQRAVYYRWLRGGDRYMGAGGTMTPLTDAPEPDDDWRSRTDMDDEWPECFTGEDE